jgi:hypothetical protein
MRRVWKASQEDPMNLAALRWFANSIENDSIELYATNRESFDGIERVLRHTLDEFKRLRAQFFVSEEENGCPNGYVLCDGVCMPSCDDLESESHEATAKSANAGTKKGAKKR